MDKESLIQSLKGIGEKKSLLFNKLGIITCEDLLHYYPRGYDRYETLSLFKDALPGKRMAVEAVVKTAPKILRLGSKSIVSFDISDRENAVVSVKFFNAPFM